MSICSVVVFTRPESTDTVHADIAARVHCEVAAAESGRVIVIIDTHDRQVMSDTIMALNDIDGVIGVSLVYEYFEPGDTIGNAPASDVARDDTACMAGESCGCDG